MSSIPNDFPGMSHLTRLKTYTDDPTPVKGIDFVSPLALKALGRLKDSEKNKHTFKLDNDLNLDDNLEEVWVSNLQKIAESLPPEVVEMLSDIFNTFLESKDDKKIELALQLIKISQENRIDLFEIFEESLNNQDKVFSRFKSKLKETINLSIKINLYKELLNWIRKSEFKRVSIIYEHLYRSPFSPISKGLDKARKDEIHDLKMKYFNLNKEIDQTIYSNDFLLNFYTKTSELLWEEDIKALTKSNEICYEQKASLEKEHAQELLKINEKYEILFEQEKEQHARNEVALKIKQEV